MSILFNPIRREAVPFIRDQIRSMGQGSVDFFSSLKRNMETANAARIKPDRDVFEALDQNLATDMATKAREKMTALGNVSDTKINQVAGLVETAVNHAQQQGLDLSREISHELNGWMNKKLRIPASRADEIVDNLKTAFNNLVEDDLVDADDAENIAEAIGHRIQSGRTTDEAAIAEIKAGMSPNFEAEEEIVGDAGFQRMVLAAKNVLKGERDALKEVRKGITDVAFDGCDEVFVTHAQAKDALKAAEEGGFRLGVTDHVAGWIGMPKPGSETLKLTIEGDKKPFSVTLPTRGDKTADAYWDDQRPQINRLTTLLSPPNDPTQKGFQVVDKAFFRNGGSTLTQDGLDRHEAAIQFFDGKSTEVQALEDQNIRLGLVGKRKPRSQDKLKVTSESYGQFALSPTSTKTAKLTGDDDAALQRGLNYASAFQKGERAQISPQLRLTDGVATKHGDDLANGVKTVFNTHQADLNDLSSNFDVTIKAKKGHWYRPGARLRINQAGAKTREVYLDTARRDLAGLQQSTELGIQYAKRAANPHPNVSHRIMLSPATQQATAQGMKKYDDLVAAFESAGAQAKLHELGTSKISVKAIDGYTIRISGLSKFSHAFNKDLVTMKRGESMTTFVNRALDRAAKGKAKRR